MTFSSLKRFLLSVYWYSRGVAKIGASGLKVGAIEECSELAEYDIAWCSFGSMPLRLTRSRVKASLKVRARELLDFWKLLIANDGFEPSCYCVPESNYLVSKN